ncbi:hypothetical protein RVV74_003071 [Enterobacter ludwigii]|nr:hypothetical protein [Enterobacter ludwigii]
MSAFIGGSPQLTWDGNAFKPERGSNHKYFVKCDWKLGDGTEAFETWSISPTLTGAMVIQHLSCHWAAGESTAHISNSSRNREIAQQMLDRLAALSMK